MISEPLRPRHLRNLKIFSSLRETELQQLLDAPENGIKDFAPRENIFEESEIGDCMYMILEGSVEVYIKSKMEDELIVETLNAGDYFGENAVLTEKPVKRTASVRAETPVKVFRLDKKCVIEALKNHKKIRGRFPPDEVRDLIMGMPMFNSLTHDELLSINDWAKVETFKENEFIFKAGSPVENFYVILDGEIELLTLGNDGTIIGMSTHIKGNTFGEIFLMPGSRKKYNIFARANTDSRILKIPKKYFLLMLSRDTNLIRKLNDIIKEEKMKSAELQYKYGR